MQEARIRILIAVAMCLLLLVIGVAGLMVFEGYSFLNACWLAIISLTTTGFGDIVPKTVGGRIFLMLLIAVGVGVLAYAMGTIISTAVETRIYMLMGRNNMRDKIVKLKDHVIICGAGRVGRAAAEVIGGSGVPYVFVDNDQDTVETVKHQGHLIWEGNAVEDEVLQAVGISKARGLIAALSDDAYNVFVVLTARALNPNLTIVARAEKPETVNKLYHAGADRVVPSALIAGQRMGAVLVKPAILDLFDNLVHSQHLTMEMLEFVAEKSSPVVGRPIREVFRPGETSVMCVSVVRGGETMINPSGDEVIKAGDILVLIGKHSDLEQFRGFLTAIS